MPYRVRFFNELAKYCDLTVMYERRSSVNRDKAWSSSIQKAYKVEYLQGYDYGNEYTFSTKISGLVSRGWDKVIVGCYNSKSQILAMLTMRLKGIPFIINLDGEPFIGCGLKSKLKTMALKGAESYLVAGEKACESLISTLGSDINVVPYYFSSLTDAENKTNASEICKREDYVLVVGQYYDYKGMDIAYKVACMDSSIRYKFVGMGSRTEDFLRDMGEMPANIEVIPFLQKKDLEQEYQKAALLMLPTRQECWGLVVNEASSFGTPIVSTWGSGAAVEFLADQYPQYLAKSGDADSLLECVKLCLKADNAKYAEYLIEKSRKYSIEKSVKSTLAIL